ncbi:sulfate adenylyltransferase subunit CysN [Sulfurimonas sp. ST-25]|uniref:sulfate adenylyltransferase subunit CysN n=1 Tax=Sulfurimonas sp. ST-25 TaxID=3400151 RepID=UPI003A84F4BB
MEAQERLIASDIERYLHEHENKELLRFITCGSVDDGKSTLIGRLLHDTKMIFEDQLAAITKESRKSGTTGERVDLALLVDGLQSEREQGITIDVAYRYFATDKRKFIIADTPGHEQYTRNMATGASTADLAIILIDARYGIQTQTRRHSFIVRLLGITRVIVAVNKMDLVDFSEGRFEAIRQEYMAFAAGLNIAEVSVIPLSALEGDNVVERSARLPWYEGATLLELLETAELDRQVDGAPFRFPVQYVNRPSSDFRGFAGTVASGAIRKGDAVKVMPSGKRSRVRSIVTFDGELAVAEADNAVTLTLEDEIDISRGDILVGGDAEIALAGKLIAELVWMDETPLEIGRTYTLKRAATTVAARVVAIDHQYDVNTLTEHEASALGLNGIARVRLALGAPIAFDPYETNRYTGSFILIDRVSNNTSAAGMIVAAAEEQALPETAAASFEAELNALIRRHFPHWEAKAIA